MQRPQTESSPIVQVYHEKSIILPDVSRVLACLYEKGIKFETHHGSFSSNKSLLRLQASSDVPVPFYDGPIFLQDSRNICRYVLSKYQHHGNPFLYGSGALDRAITEQWYAVEAKHFDPPSRALFCHLAFPQDEKYYDDDIHLHIRNLEKLLDIYEDRLGINEYLAGDNFTLADLAHLPNCHHIAESGWLSYLLESRKNVRRWWNAISSRDSWRQVSRYIKRIEQQSKEYELRQLQAGQKKRRAAVARQVRKDPRKHIVVAQTPNLVTSTAKPEPLPDDDSRPDVRRREIRGEPRTIRVPLPPAT